MSLLESLLGAQNGQAVNSLSRRFGLTEQQVQSALGTLVPALSQGLRRNTAQPGGLESLASALGGGRHQRYLEDPASLEQPETVEDGNGILGHIFGSKDVSRQVASAAAERTGISSDMLKKMLPVVAAMVMGSLSRKAQSQGTPSPGGVGGLGGLTSMLDSNRDGSVADDILGMAGKFFR